MLGRNLFISFFCFASTALCQSAHLVVSQPNGEAIDQEVKIQVKELSSFQKVRVDAQAEDCEGKIWSSFAIFSADSRGCIDLSSAKPMKGSSYETIDAMGLFWSMLPSSGDCSSYFKNKGDSFPVEIKLFTKDNNLIEQTGIARCLLKPGVKKIDVREKGLVGTLFLPQSKTPRPVIITLSGSGGGLSETRAKLLSSHGFAVLALAYFGVDGLPPLLQNIPLEYFESAFTWLKNQPLVDSSHIGLYGVSRGGELALILGSFFPNATQAIVAAVPSSAVYGALNEYKPNVPAWTYHGKPFLSLAPISKPSFSYGQSASSPIDVRNNFIEGMKEKETFSAALIPVENIQCPLLIISGGDDHMWPSDIYCNQIEERLKTLHSPISFYHLHYPKAGHAITCPYFPVQDPISYHAACKLWFSFGGSREANAQASADSWKKIVAFFQETLDSHNQNIAIVQAKKSMTPLDKAKIKEKNQKMLSFIRKYNLPLNDYAITGSGPLGIRNLRAIHDIDIIVTPELWDRLASSYGIKDEKGVRKIVFPDGVVEAFTEGSFYSDPLDEKAPTITQRIHSAEIIEGLPFDSLETVLYFKHKNAREKDLKDIALIEGWMKEHKG